MKRGTFIMMDALGFKGAWKAPTLRSPEDLLCVLKSLSESASNRLGEMLIEPPFRVHGANTPTLAGAAEPVVVRFLSDTIVVAVESRNEWHEKVDIRDGYSLVVACAFASSVLASAAASPRFPLAYRGCVSIGEYAIDDNFIVGPAVDEAAEGERKAQGAFVYMNASALRIFEKVSFDGSCTFLDHKVPLKDGTALPTKVLMPFNIGGLGAAHLGNRVQIVECLKKTFSRGATRADVSEKQTNTVAFLDAASANLIGQQP